MAGRKERVMWHDLAALTPPLVVCAAFIIGLAIFLRREMGARHDRTRGGRRRTRGRRS
jgi:Ni/Fe-hydrogenase subunit HybB-like protein